MAPPERWRIGDATTPLVFRRPGLEADGHNGHTGSYLAYLVEVTFIVAGVGLEETPEASACQAPRGAGQPGRAGAPSDALMATASDQPRRGAILRPMSCPSCGHLNPASASTCDRCGASLAAHPPSALSPGDLIEGRYRVDRF